MENFDFEAPADVFTGRGGSNSHGVMRNHSHGTMRYRRFRTGAEAVRHVIENQKSDLLGGTTVEVDGRRFEAAQIRELYDRPDYPLPRSTTN
jgi:hypothetical protein